MKIDTRKAVIAGLLYGLALSVAILAVVVALVALVAWLAS